jgi:hypothetical protein
MKISQHDYLRMVATIAAGIMANPTSGTVAMDSYARQNIMTGVINDLAVSLAAAGHQLIEDPI